MSWPSFPCAPVSVSLSTARSIFPGGVFCVFFENASKFQGEQDLTLATLKCEEQTVRLSISVSADLIDVPSQVPSN